MTPTTPILLLTGYLGSGKTTLLNRMLTNQKGIKFAVIVNDIGEVNIDAELIQKGGVVNQDDDSLVALQNGCICCSLKINLMQQLQEIVATNRFDYIVIEASGICEPAPIAQTICAIPHLSNNTNNNGIPQLDCIVTVVDALRMRDEFGSGNQLLHKQITEDDIENLVIQQIEFCNIILLNKAAEVTAEELQQIKNIVRAIQPVAKIIECNYGDVNFNEILHTQLFDFDSVAASATWIRELETHRDEEPDISHTDHHHHKHEHHHHHKHSEGETDEYGISTFVYYQRKPFNISQFDNFVARKLPKNIIRIKGICYFQNEMDTCYMFEQAGKQISLKDIGLWFATMPEDERKLLMERDATFRADWHETYGDRMQKIVFIGRDMDKSALCHDLDECLA